MLQHCFEEIQFSISVNAEPLDPAAEFPCLVCTVAYNNSDWVVLYHNLWKTKLWWGMVGEVVTKMGEAAWAQWMIYKEIVQ